MFSEKLESTKRLIHRLVPAAGFATLAVGAIAICGVAATHQVDFSVEDVGATVDVATDESASSVASTPSATPIPTPVISPALGLVIPASPAEFKPAPSSQALASSDTESGTDGDAADELNVDSAEAVDQQADSTEQGEPEEFTQASSAGSEIEDVAVDEPSDRQPFAAVGGITLYGPADDIEIVGFHESANTQSQEMRPLDTPLDLIDMPSRGRGTGSHSAVDMAVEPGEKIYSPVSGVVVDAREYKLYCKHVDHVVIIEPDAAPDHQVKVLHISGLLVSNGDRVVAGQTPIAEGPTPLPFGSQIDGFVANPTNTHVHIETVDLNLEDTRNSTVCP